MKTFLFFLLSLPLLGLPDKLEKDVVYVEEFAENGIKLKVEKAGWVYPTKKGGQRSSALKVGTSVELVSFTDNAYFVRGTNQRGRGVFGWVTPAAFTSKDPKFVEKLKAVHTRQIAVRALIEKGEIAVGMTGDEVTQILGKPTKTKVRRTAKGQSQVWEFVEFEERDHYTTVRDPYTGAIFRQFSHTTREEKEKTVVEFSNGFVTATEVTTDNGPAKPVIVSHPVIFTW